MNVGLLQLHNTADIANILHEQRRGHAAQIERVGQIRLKIALDEFDGALHFIDRQRGVVVLRDIDFAHTGFTP